jgi:hypothetical protein
MKPEATAEGGGKAVCRTDARKTSEFIASQAGRPAFNPTLPDLAPFTGHLLPHDDRARAVPLVLDLSRAIETH